MALLMIPRILLGLLFHLLWYVGLIHRFGDTMFSATALVTVFNEKPDDLERCLSGLKRSLEVGTTQHSLLVIIDGYGHPDPAVQQACRDAERIASSYADVVLCTTAQNKRSNLRALTTAAREKGLLNDILILVDSDTYLNDTHVVRRLLRPFSDPRIGGTTTAQRIRDPQTIAERVSDWLEDARKWSGMAAASLFRQVLCLPGRMIALRTELVEHHMDDLVNDTFSVGPFGPWRCKAGDDRFLTNCVLRQGFGTILVPNAGVTTEAKKTMGETFTMWTRWGRSSQGYTLRSPWLFKPQNWMAAFIGWGDILVTLSTVFIIALHWPYAYLTGSVEEPLLQMLMWSLVGMAATVLSRQWWHLVRHPRNLVLLPAFLYMITVGQFIRFYAFMTPWLIDNWGTRGAQRRAQEVRIWELGAETSVQS